MGPPICFFTPSTTLLEVTTTKEGPFLDSSLHDYKEDSSLLLVDPLDSLMPSIDLFTPSSSPQDTLKIAHYLSSPLDNCVSFSNAINSLRVLMKLWYSSSFKALINIKDLGLSLSSLRFSLME